MPSILVVNQSLLDYYNVSLNTNSKQHKDTTESRLHRDNDDSNKFFYLFTAYDSFSINNGIINIASGFIGDENINCYAALEIGCKSINNIIGKSMKSIAFKKTDGVIYL